MSIVKYTTKYTLIGALAILVCAVIGGFVYSKYQKNDLKLRVEVHGRPNEVVLTDDSNVWEKVEVDVKRPKRTGSHTHIDGDTHHLHVDVTPPFLQKLPRDLQKRLDKVDSNGNSYYSNPNYFQEVFEAVSNGQDMETTIKLLKEYGIYTPVVLEHMDSYEAFRYVIEEAPTDYKGPYVSGGDDIKYAKRVIGEDPRSSEALEAGLYIARVLQDPHEKDTYYRGVLKYHPNSSTALYGLGKLLNYDRPSEGIVYLKKATDLDPFICCSFFGVRFVYRYFSDYRSR